MPQTLDEFGLDLDTVLSGKKMCPLFEDQLITTVQGFTLSSISCMCTVTRAWLRSGNVEDLCITSETRRKRS